MLTESEVVPEPSRYKFWEIERLANEIAKKHNFDYEDQSIASFAVKLGGAIIVMDDPAYSNWKSGKLHVYGPENFEIYLSPITSTARDNFTIAHELGHLFLHTGDPWGSLATRERPLIIERYFPALARKQMDKEKRNALLVEQQANRFAAALLMPDLAFSNIAIKTKLSDTPEGGYDLERLAGHFRVSPSAVTARLKSLGLL